MTKVNDEQLVIIIDDTAPSERKQWLMQAISASMRWYTFCEHGIKTQRDKDYIFVLESLLQTLLK